MMNNYYIGIMTGTSADALDGCIVSFDDKFQLIESASINLDKSYKKNYEECIKAGFKEIHESKKLLELENILNEKTIELIRAENKKVGISLKPNSKIDLVEKYLSDIDLVLIMSVEPGFGGQKFMPEVLKKIRELKKIQNEKKLDFDIEIDGGINFDNCKDVVEAGANILVSGTTIFKSNNGDIKKNINLLKLK